MSEQNKKEEAKINPQTKIDLEDGVEITVPRNKLIFIILMNTFICEFAFAVENVWITSLLIQFQTESYLDSFIWIIPNIVSILLTPYLQSYINKYKVPFMKYLTFILVSLLLAAVGHFFVILSTLPQFVIAIQKFPIHYHFLRIFISIIGWTTIDASLQFVGNYTSQIKSVLTEKSISFSVEQEESFATLARISAYGLSFLATGTKFSHRNFHIQCSRMYYVSGLLCITGVIIMFILNKTKVNKGEEKYRLISFSNIKQTILGTRLSITTFFPGLWQTFQAPLKLKAILLQYFCYNYVVDTLYIYSCIWFATTVIESQQITSEMFMTGVKYGALTFLGLAIVSHLTKLIYRPVLKTKFFKASYIMVVLITFGITLFATFKLYIWLIITIVLLGGMLLSLSQLFLEQKEDSIQKEFQQYESCIGYVGVIEKLFILCPMPFYWMIIRNADDIPGSLIFSTVALLILFSVLMYDQFSKPAVKVEAVQAKAKKE